MFYLKNYKFFIIYYLFFFIPKIKLGNDIYVWPFELFMILFILYFVYTGKEIIYDRSLLYPIIFFTYLIIISFVHIILRNYPFSLPEFLRNIKIIIYFVFLLFMFSYLYNINYGNKFDYHVIVLMVFFSTILMFIMLIQNFYNFFQEGLPDYKRMFWIISSKIKPYFFACRYISEGKIIDNPKGGLNSTGILATLVFFLAIYLFTENRNKFFFLSIVLSFITLLLSYSRSSFIIFFLLLITMITLNKKNKDYLTLLSSLLLFFFILFIFSRDFFYYTVLSKIINTFNFNGSKFDPSTHVRIIMWEHVLFGKINYLNLIFGCGFGQNAILYFTNNKFTQLESLFLNNLVYGGIFSILFIIFYINLIKKSLILKKNNQKLGNILYFFFIYFSLPNIFTGGDFLMDTTMHYIFPLIVIIYIISKNHLLLKL